MAGQDRPGQNRVDNVSRSLTFQLWCFAGACKYPRPRSRTRFPWIIKPTFQNCLRIQSLPPMPTLLRQVHRLKISSVYYPSLVAKPRGKPAIFVSSKIPFFRILWFFRTLSLSIRSSLVPTSNLSWVQYIAYRELVIKRYSSLRSVMTNEDRDPEDVTSVTSLSNTASMTWINYIDRLELLWSDE